MPAEESDYCQPDDEINSSGYSTGGTDPYLFYAPAEDLMSEGMALSPTSRLFGSSRILRKMLMTTAEQAEHVATIVHNAPQIMKCFATPEEGEEFADAVRDITFDLPCEMDDLKSHLEEDLGSTNCASPFMILCRILAKSSVNEESDTNCKTSIRIMTKYSEESKSGIRSVNRLKERGLKYMDFKDDMPQDAYVGDFSEVYYVQDEYNKRYALTLLDTTKFKDLAQLKRQGAKRQCFEDSHQGIVKLYAFSFERRFAWTLHELTEYGNLQDYSEIYNPETEGFNAHSLAVKVLAALLPGLAHMWCWGTHHGNIKPNNIMLRGGDVRCLAFTDFGESKITYTEGGMSPYRGAKMDGNHQCSGLSADIKATGCVLLALIVGVSKYENHFLVHEGSMDVVWKWAEHSNASKQLLALIGKMMDENPNERPDLYELSTHACVLEGKSLPGIENLYKSKVVERDIALLNEFGALKKENFRLKQQLDESSIPPIVADIAPAVSLESIQEEESDATAFSWLEPEDSLPEASAKVSKWCSNLDAITLPNENLSEKNVTVFLVFKNIAVFAKNTKFSDVGAEGNRLAHLMAYICRMGYSFTDVKYARKTYDNHVRKKYPGGIHRFWNDLQTALDSSLKHLYLALQGLRHQGCMAVSDRDEMRSLILKSFDVSVNTVFGTGTIEPHFWSQWATQISLRFFEIHQVGLH